MAKIVVRIPEPKEEYDVSNQKQIRRAIALIVEQLNSTYLQDLKEENERYAWFKGGSGGDC
jgi:hypothetical protein